MRTRTLTQSPDRPTVQAPPDRQLPESAESAGLQDFVLRTARREIDRRGMAPGDADADLLARQAAAGALAAIAADVACCTRHAPFAMWAGKFAVAEVSAKIARQEWRSRQAPAAGDGWDRLPAVLGLRPGDRDEAAAALRRAADHGLSEQQRAVFTAVVVDDVPTDVLALDLGSTRNAVYKALFEARRVLGDQLAGHAWGGEALDRLLEVTPGDAGCDIVFQELDRYVDAERRGLRPRLRLPSVAVHLDACEPCRRDYQGLSDAARAEITVQRQPG